MAGRSDLSEVRLPDAEEAAQVSRARYVIFWLEQGRPRALASDELVAALHACEALRVQQRAGAPISHPTMSVNDSEHVGQAGVASAVDYEWTMRRVPATGRPRRR